jgi:hypothetical protein
MMTKNKKSRTKSTKTVKVSGHWVFIKAKPGKAPVTYYVKPYKYERKPAKKVRKKHLPIRVYPGKKIPPTPPGYVLDKHYDITEADERVVYTYKIEVLVEYQGRYLTSFSMDKDLAGQKAIEFYHTKFEPTIVKATVDFHEQMKLLRAYGHLIQFMSIDLYRVTGVGTLKEKHWRLIRSYNEPEDVK